MGREARREHLREDEERAGRKRAFPQERADFGMVGELILPSDIELHRDHAHRE